MITVMLVIDTPLPYVYDYVLSRKSPLCAPWLFYWPLQGSKVWLDRTFESTMCQ